MKNEIKEILDKCTPFLFGDEVDKLTNYITNLQTIEQQYSAILSENAELEYKVTDLSEYIGNYVNIVLHDRREIDRLHNIIEKARAKSILLQNKYGYILDDLTFSLSTGSDNNVKKN